MQKVAAKVAKKGQGQHVEVPGNTTKGGLGNTLPENPGQVRHIFRDAMGHLSDTPANRQLLTDLTNNPANRIGKDRFGNDIFILTRPDGSQIWGQSRNGAIQNGGLNETPWTFEPGVGLRRP